MNLIRTSFWSSISSIFRIIAGLIITKIIAVVVGPSGVALLGNFTNITSIFTTFANGGITSGITKYIAEFNTEEERSCVISHAFKINLICSFIIGLIVIVLNKSLAQLAFGDVKYSIAFILFGVTVVFYGMNSTISAVLNGYKYIKYLIIISVTGSVLSVILAMVITIRFGVFGAIINTMIAQVFIFLFSIVFVRKLKLFHSKLLYISLNRSLLWKLFNFATMSLVSALFVTTSMFLIRNYIYKNFSPNEAGYIQGMWSISSAYLMVITTTLSTYYLPTLSRLKDPLEIRREILRGYKYLLPLALVGGLAVYICKDIIIYILYTPTFLPMRKYFAFQIIGDTLKVASFMLAHMMIAKAMTRWYIVSEVIFSFMYVGLSFLFMSAFGSVGVTYAYTVNYLLYLIFMMVLFRRILFPLKSKRLQD